MNPPTVTFIDNKMISTMLQPVSVSKNFFGGCLAGAALGAITGAFKGGIVKEHLIASTIIMALTLSVNEICRENVLNSQKSTLKEKCSAITGIQFITLSIAVLALKRFGVIGGTLAVVFGIFVLMSLLGNVNNLSSFKFEQAPQIPLPPNLQRLMNISTSPN